MMACSILLQVHPVKSASLPFFSFLFFIYVYDTNVSFVMSTDDAISTVVTVSVGLLLVLEIYMVNTQKWINTNEAVMECCSSNQISGLEQTV